MKTEENAYAVDEHQRLGRSTTGKLKIVLTEALQTCDYSARFKILQGIRELEHQAEHCSRGQRTLSHSSQNAQINATVHLSEVKKSSISFGWGSKLY
jgi:hypothetical protein